jgi:hypothetical protein
VRSPRPLYRKCRVSGFPRFVASILRIEDYIRALSPYFAPPCPAGSPGLLSPRRFVPKGRRRQPVRSRRSCFSATNLAEMRDGMLRSTPWTCQGLRSRCSCRRCRRAVGMCLPRSSGRLRRDRDRVAARVAADGRALHRRLVRLPRLRPARRCPSSSRRPRRRPCRGSLTDRGSSISRQGSPARPWASSCSASS